jgi:WD40 repeat protein
VYRGVLLYGDSGSGKSSVVNAGLIPEAIRLGFAPERLRVQPRAGEELVIERIDTADGEEQLLPSVLALDEESLPRTVLAMDLFEERVRAACERSRPLLIFDQFEEIVTLFDEAGARDAQRRLVELIVRLLRGPLPVKVAFSFRDDYLGKVKELLSACPELIDQALRIAAPTTDKLPTIIRGPFERYPNHFERPLSQALADRLVTALAERFGTGDISLSEVQTVCLRLWNSDNPEELLTEKGPQGLLEDYLGEALDHMPAQLRPTAIALLGQMVTSAGTRNVISAADLFQRVEEQEGDITPGLFDQALDGLSKSRLVRREHRRDLDLYEITSEFLVPWISRRREEFRRWQDRRRDRRRLLVVGSIATALLLVAAVVTGLYFNAQNAKAFAITQRDQAIYTQIMAEAQQYDASNTPLAAQLDFADYHRQPTPGLYSHLLSTENTPLSSPVSGGSGPVYTVAFSPVGQLMATGDYDGTLRLWDTTNPAHPRILSASQLTGEIEAAAFSRDGDILAIGDSDNMVQLWNVADPAHPHQVGQSLTGGTNVVDAVAFSPDGQVLASGDDDGTIQLWNVADPDNPKALGQPVDASSEGVDSVAFSPNGHILASGDFDDYVRLWNVAGPSSPKPVGKPLTGGTESVDSVAFSSEGILASGDWDDTIRLWNVANPADPQSLGPPLTGNTDAVNSVAFSPNGQLLASGSYDATVRLWDVVDPAQPQPLGEPATGGNGTVFSVAFSPDGSTLASGGEAGAVRLWLLPATQLIGSTGAVSSVAFNLHGGTLASGGVDGMIQVWDVADPAHPVQLGHPLAGGIGDINTVAFSPDGRTLAAGGSHGTIRLWDMAHPAHPQPLIPPLPGPSGMATVSAVVFSPNGQTLAGCGYDKFFNGIVQLWNVHVPARPVALGQPLTASMNSEAMLSLAFSRDGSMLAGGTGFKGVDLWNVANPAYPQQWGQTFYSGTDNINSMAFSKDGGILILATGNNDGSVQLWNVTHPASPKKLGPPLAGTTPVNSVVFSRDGRTLAIGSDNGTVGLWNVSNPASPKEIGQPFVAAVSYINSVAFSPDSHMLANGALVGTLASGSKDGTIRLWNLNVNYAITRICATTANDLTPQLWRINVPQLPYQPPCAR